MDLLLCHKFGSRMNVLYFCAMQKHNLFIHALLLIATLWMGGSEVSAQSVIPVPLRVEQGSGVFRISKDTKLYTNLKANEKKKLDAYLATLPAPFNVGTGRKKSPSGNAIIFRKTLPGAASASDTSACSESYTLEVGSKQIQISADTDAGLFYGLQTLLQAANPTGEDTWTVPAIHVADAPRYSYRGFMLDVSRHFRSKDFVKKQIDALARYKLNHLHLHLTDAAGWRIEIKKYPRLTEYAAWRPEANWKKWWFGEDSRKYCEQTDPRAQGGFYTQDDIRELVNYAAQRHITIIPEIEMPAHSEEVLAAYPEFSCSGEPYRNADFCVGNERTFAFLEDVLTEVMELFPSRYIHVGGDEAGKAAWKTCPKCHRRMEEEKLNGVNELQSYLIHRIEVFLNAHGRKLLGWDEIMEGGLAPNATVMSWRGEEGGINAVRAGHRAIMTPGGYCYLDSYQDAPYSQPEAIGGYLPLAKVYAYEPLPSSLTPDEAKLVYGVQGNLWAEYISTAEHCEYMIYPRILAIAEVAWSDAARKNYTDFHRRALREIEWLKAQGYHPFDLKNEIGDRPEAKQPVSHLALGMPVKYNAPYNKSYMARGDKTLTDGRRGNWTYSDGAWQGFISPRRLDVTIDMKTVQDIHSIGADFMQVVGAEVYLPAEVIISVSTDGTSFRELKRITHKVTKNDAVAFRNYNWQGNAHARYIRYEARAEKNLGGWVFTDEIVVDPR